jgi:hypothetical protein
MTCSRRVSRALMVRAAPGEIKPLTGSDAGNRRTLDQPLAASGLRTEQ